MGRFREREEGMQRGGQEKRENIKAAVGQGGTEIWRERDRQENKSYGRKKAEKQWHR